MAERSSPRRCHARSREDRVFVAVERVRGEQDEHRWELSACPGCLRAASRSESSVDAEADNAGEKTKSGRCWTWPLRVGHAIVVK